MYGKNIDYTIASSDERFYNRIYANLCAPSTFRAQMIVTGLTSKCAIVVLDGGSDYIIINGAKYIFQKSYTDLNEETFSYLLIELLKDQNFNVVVDETRRIIIRNIKNAFVIDDCSYNVKLLCGFYNTTFPISSSYIDGYGDCVKAKSVGYYLSTPILYLVSNIGTHAYRTTNREDCPLSGSKIVMRINNSYSANFPIIANNGDFSTEVLSNDLSDAQFTLVDANMHEIKLLCPMYICISVTGIQDPPTYNLYGNY